MSTKKILLNSCPPAYIDSPLASVSVMKTFLEKEGYSTGVFYWNLMLRRVTEVFYPWEEASGTTRYLLPFLYIKARNSNKSEDMNSIYKYYHSLDDAALAREDFDEKIQEFESYLYDNIDKIDWSDKILVGFSAKLDQVFCAELIASRIKSINPDCIIYLGGADDCKSAEAYIRNYPCFDYVIWGEGEYPTLHLARFVEGIADVDSLCNTVRRDGNKTVVSRRNTTYVPLSEVVPDFSDYFAVKHPPVVFMPIEGSRSCKWGKCRFCCFNAGYRYRRKSNKDIQEELLTQIKKYRNTNFHFTDNAINDLCNDDFEDLLNKIIEVKAIYPNLSFYMAEVMSKGLDCSLIQKLSLAGFKRIQVGYESLSDELLCNIKKVNTVASNLLFIKWAHIYGITVVGSNIIRNLLEETDTDITTSIENLRYLRFNIGKHGFRNNLVLLSVNHLSKYNKLIQEANFSGWYCRDIQGLTPSNYMAAGDDYILHGYVKSRYNHLWNQFKETENEYLRQNYRYAIFESKGNHRYNEYKDDKLYISYDLNNVCWRILVACNEHVVRMNDLPAILNSDASTINESVAFLQETGLLYHSSFNDECVSIINTNI